MITIIIIIIVKVIILVILITMVAIITTIVISYYIFKICGISKNHVLSKCCQKNHKEKCSNNSEWTSSSAPIS